MLFTKALDQGLEGLAFDLQAWIKHSSCKEDDFRELSDKTIIEDESFSAKCRQKMIDTILGTGENSRKMG